MTERIKLTEEEISYDYDDENGLCIYIKTLDEFEQLKQQILDDYEKVNLLTESELRDLPLLKVAGEQALEIKHLQELLDRSLDNTDRNVQIGETQVSLLERLNIENKQLKEINQTMIENNFESKLQKERDNLKQKLEKIKELMKKDDESFICEDENYWTLCKELKKILDSHESKEWKAEGSRTWVESTNTDHERPATTGRDGKSPKESKRESILGEIKDEDRTTDLFE